MKISMRARLTACVMGLAILLALTPMPAHASPRYETSCYNGITSVAATDPKNPASCGAGNWYVVFDKTNSKEVLRIQIPPNSSKLIEALKSGYNSVNKFCNANSTLCNVITSVGVAVAQYRMAGKQEP